MPSLKEVHHGEQDVHLPANRGEDLLREYFAEGGNTDLTVVIFESASHSMNNLMPASWDQLYAWSGQLYE